jgi:uncharacterized membrane protein
MTDDNNNAADQDQAADPKVPTLHEKLKSSTHKTALGVDENFEALLTYVLFFISGFIFLLVEKENLYVRFHALQSLVTFLGIWIILFVLSHLPFLGGFLEFMVSLLTIILWCFLMYKAYIGEAYKLPGIGDFVEQHLVK